MRYRRAFISTLLVSTVTLGSVSLALATSQESAVAEYDRVMLLTPDKENGSIVYRTCAVCHGPEAWGREDGYYPQIAGQLRTVLIKQLADIRARNRDNPTMFPFTMPQTLGGEQEIADVAAYVADLPMVPRNGIGPGFDLGLGERLYKDNCVECHGKSGEGDKEDHIPMIRGQHFRYLVRQFQWIKSGRRRNADSKMVKQIKRFTGRDLRSVMDYISRLGPPEEKRAEPSWQNPDFPKFVRPRHPRYPAPPNL